MRPSQTALDGLSPFQAHVASTVEQVEALLRSGLDRHLLDLLMSGLVALERRPAFSTLDADLLDRYSTVLQAHRELSS